MSLNPIRFLIFTIVLLMIVSCSPGATERTDADNTARNDHDNNGAVVAQTPFDQGENESDLEITANIRKAIVADDSLSSNAHNVKIITAAGMVTLRGPVENEREKTTIEAKATEIAGASKVQSFLEVETKP